MQHRRRQVGFFLRELLLWGVVVGFAVNLFTAPVEASATRSDGQSCLVSDVHGSPALHARSMHRWQSDSSDLLQPKLACGPSCIDDVAEAVSARLTLANTWAGSHTVTTLVMLGIRLQI
ncbi:hypothetical protein [Aporhodopirellula aestuarii]|uniref:Secreted protein n=1 Tax=Aporhodopirellula aestuarii TaxID=2950107 RepID=A0ABT0U083_9BACT|nr:hypothetical protein [Aporhodopirellula aestuarii]MCM2370267.1 hypothetical protein [Aporhodopirellula aestuarii]